MNQGRVSVSYARALLEWACEGNIADEVYAQSEQLRVLVEKNPDFYQMLSSPMVSPAKKRDVASIVIGKFAPSLCKFILLIINKKREKFLNNIILVFQRLYRERFGIIRTNVECISELSTKAQEVIANYLASTFNKKVELMIRLNPDIIGGFVLIIEDQLLDKSVKGELEKLRKKLHGIE